MQWIHGIPLIWKQKTNNRKIKYRDKYDIRTRQSPNKKARMIVSDKITAREIYSALLLLSGNTPTSQKYFDKAFPNENFD